MTDPKTLLRRLKKNLNILRQREAKYGRNVPLELLNQIEDHEKAISLTQQAIAGDLNETEWQDALKPLLVDIEERTGEAKVTVSHTSIYSQIYNEPLIATIFIGVILLFIVFICGLVVLTNGQQLTAALLNQINPPVSPAGGSTTPPTETSLPVLLSVTPADSPTTAPTETSLPTQTLVPSPVAISSPTNTAPPVGCSFQEDTNPPNLTIAELWYTVGDEPEQSVASGDTIKLAPNQSLCVRYMTYASADSSKLIYGVWSEVIIRKDDWDFNDLRPIDAVPVGAEKLAALENGPGCWTTVADTWSELSAQLIHANEPSVGCEVDDRLFVTLVITATATPTPSAPPPPDANEIAFDAPVSGQLDSPLESDPYTVSGAAGDLIWVRLIDKQLTSFFPKFRLNDSAGNEVCAAQSSSFVDKVCSLSADGPHKLFVENSSGDRHGPYDLYLQRINNPVGVQPLVLGEVQSGDLDSPVELDGYRFEAPAGAQVLIRLFDKGQTDFFPVFWLYDSQGNQVCTATASSEAKTTCQLELGGVYVVYAGNSSGNNIGAYELVVQLQ